MHAVNLALGQLINGFRFCTILEDALNKMLKQTKTKMLFIMFQINPNRMYNIHVHSMYYILISKLMINACCVSKLMSRYYD